MTLINKNSILREDTSIKRGNMKQTQIRFWAYKENSDWYYNKTGTPNQLSDGIANLLEANKENYEHPNKKIQIQLSRDTPGGFATYYLKWQEYCHNGSRYLLNNLDIIDIQHELIPYTDNQFPDNEFYEWAPGHIYLKFISRTAHPYPINEED